MAKFTPNRAVMTKDPTVVVDAGLTVGSHIFQLVVVNQRRVQSSPAFVTVTIVRSSQPGGGRIGGEISGIVIPGT